MKVVVFGSAHLDILAEAVSGKGTIDRPGNLRIHVGGTAYNLAVNLAAMGVKVTFCSAFNRSAISRMIVNELAQNGVELAVDYDDALPDSGFSAHVENGDAYSCVSSMAVEHHVFEEAFVREHIQGAAWVCLETNLSTRTLDQITCIARDMGIPTSVQLVSEEKGLKLAQITPPDYVFGNIREHQYLLANAANWEATETMVTFVTNGPHKALAYRGTALEASAAPDPVGGMGNALGAGDAFTTGTIVSILKHPGAALAEAMEIGHITAQQVLDSPHCNFGAHEVLNKTLGELSDRAHHDKLTSLLNRTGAEPAFMQVDECDDPYAVIFLDLDHFKAVNDSHGHEVGDKALVFVADILKEHMRESDVLVRYGGEEFVVILPNAGQQQALDIAERLVGAVRSTKAPPPLNRLTVSAGVAYNEGGERLQETIRRADDALYNSKAMGRDRATLDRPKASPVEMVS